MTINNLTKYDHLIKVILIGNSGVGKSSLMIQFADNLYSEKYISTIGVDFKISALEYNNLVIKFQIWDTAGQERFKTITRSYYRGADVILLVFDLTETKSFDSLTKWNDDINFNATSNVIKILVGNKKDIKTYSPDSNEITNYIKKYKYLNYIETSAKDAEGLDQLFLYITKEFIKKKENDKIKISESNGSSNKIFKLDNKFILTKPNEKKCC